MVLRVDVVVGDFRDLELRVFGLRRAAREGRDNTGHFGPRTTKMMEWGNLFERFGGLSIRSTAPVPHLQKKVKVQVAGPRSVALQWGICWRAAALR
jgi:hypothetical protein